MKKKKTPCTSVSFFRTIGGYMTTASWNTEAAALSSLLAEKGLAVVAGRWAGGTSTTRLDHKKEALGAVGAKNYGPTVLPM